MNWASGHVFAMEIHVGDKPLLHFKFVVKHLGFISFSDTTHLLFRAFGMGGCYDTKKLSPHHDILPLTPHNLNRKLC